ncbi:hypothetical protein H6P81_007369 [Aristolochia fimbriata]|uniref:Uncharacterized protein n=1 Tax=Aristolochia fimbriata TaxID=158543 RepID=A0AAV7F281_ARIFI|nr:hypothetical protein H6P81_007369 [Aristolochia fimbriata]
MARSRHFTQNSNKRWYFQLSGGVGIFSSLEVLRNIGISICLLVLYEVVRDLHVKRGIFTFAMSLSLRPSDTDRLLPNSGIFSSLEVLRNIGISIFLLVLYEVVRYFHVKRGIFTSALSLSLRPSDTDRLVPNSSNMRNIGISIFLLVLYEVVRYFHVKRGIFTSALSLSLRPSDTDRLLPNSSNMVFSALWRCWYFLVIGV